MRLLIAPFAFLTRRRRTRLARARAAMARASVLASTPAAELHMPEPPAVAELVGRMRGRRGGRRAARFAALTLAVGAATAAYMWWRRRERSDGAPAERFDSGTASTSWGEARRDSAPSGAWGQPPAPQASSFAAEPAAPTMGATVAPAQEAAPASDAERAPAEDAAPASNGHAPAAAPALVSHLAGGTPPRPGGQPALSPVRFGLPGGRFALSGGGRAALP